MRQLPLLSPTVLERHRLAYAKPIGRMLEKLAAGEAMLWRRKFSKDPAKQKKEREAERHDTKLQEQLLKRDLVKAYVKRIAEIDAGEPQGITLVAPKRLDEIAAEFESMYGGEKVPKEIAEFNDLVLRKLFDYDKGFAQGRCPDIGKCWPDASGRYGWCENEDGWGAVALLLKYHDILRYCPYCNADTVYVFGSNKRYVKSSLDHFYPQSRFPFLALSLYNLIPSCTRCNSNIKGDRNVISNGLKSPFGIDVHGQVIFAPVIKELAAFHGKPKVGAVAIRALPREGGGVGQVGFFKVPSLYESAFEQEIVDSIRRATMYAEPHLRHLKEVLHARRLEEVERLVFGNPIDPDEINKYRLSKLRIDLHQVFGR